jgi:glycosyltransferase involved in cell wall biosynthesis
MKILLVLNLQPAQRIWWWDYLPESAKESTIHIAKIPETSQSRLATLWALAKLLPILNKYDVVLTLQDGYATYLFSLVSAVFRRKKFVHVIHQFITSPRSEALYSRLKYRFLRFCLASVDCIFCSSNTEIAYYKKELRIPKTEFRYIPLVVNPSTFDLTSKSQLQDYVISAGRTGRDYGTLVDAIRDTQYRLHIVADPRNLSGIELPPNVVVDFNIPLDDLLNLMAGARFVVIPLHDLPVSIGQSVIIKAMALGKAVIASDTAGTEDYLVNGKTGILVPPGNPDALRTAITQLHENPDYTKTLGDSARVWAKEHLTPEKNIVDFCKILSHLTHTKQRT